MHTGSGAHPRPQFVRPGWISLDGPWEFEPDPGESWSSPEEVPFSARIRVPFSPETEMSGVGDLAFCCSCWYRRTFELPEMRPPTGRWLLHFGAVDYVATVWIDGSVVCRHEGGYTPFTADITHYLKGGGQHEVIVRAEDDPHDLAKPRGKQDWQLDPHSIWYPRTTGIWQSVWLEPVPDVWLGPMRWTANLERWEIGFRVRMRGRKRKGLRVTVRLEAGHELLADDSYAVTAGDVHRRIPLSDPGIDDSRNQLLWRPEHPTLIDAAIDLWDEHGERVDTIQSYTALRAVSVQGDRLLLNGRPQPLRMVLDQGYWPKSGLTAPDHDAFRRDLELIHAMGFNGVRMHQKIEDPRFLYWADRLGIMVWEEMPSAYRFTADSVERVVQEWTRVIERDASHPSVIAWVPFNESWGVPNLPDSRPERHYVEAVYHLTKTLDPSRPVIGNDGWEAVATDLIGIHDYDADPERLGRRYQAPEQLPRLFRRERPGGRMLVLDGHPTSDHPIVLSEFGGISFAPPEDRTAWGYSTARTPAELLQRYRALMEVVGSLEVLAGFCYTQFSDTYQETNGLVYADRTPKMPIEEIARATLGPAVRAVPEGPRETLERSPDDAQARHMEVA